MGHSEEFKNQIWKQGSVVSNENASMWRKDQCGAWIQYSEHGNRNSQFGWEIDQITPDGGYTESNCRPLQWKNNLDKRDGNLKCRIKAMDKKKEEKKRNDWD